MATQIPDHIYNPYTVIVQDHSEHPTVPRTHSITAWGKHPEDASGEAECGQAIEVWKRRFPQCPDPIEVPEDWTEQERDDAWRACMESVATLAVIEGHPQVWVEDAIFFPDEVNIG